MNRVDYTPEAQAGQSTELTHAESYFREIVASGSNLTWRSLTEQGSDQEK